MNSYVFHRIDLNGVAVTKLNSDLSIDATIELESPDGVYWGKLDVRVKDWRVVECKELPEGFEFSDLLEHEIAARCYQVQLDDFRRNLGMTEWLPKRVK